MKPDLGRWALIGALIAGVSYVASWSLDLTEPAQTAWKGAGVALLAVYCALNARDRDGWLIALVMALGATGDVLLETHGLIVGAVAFLAGHLFAIWLYARNRREALSKSQLALAIVLVPAVVAIAYLLPNDRAMAPGVALYSAGLAIMAAMAWTSRFPRFRVGVGAILFVVSDLLIFARSGPLEGVAGMNLAVWATYFAGQALIAWGVVRALADKGETA